MMPSTHIRKPHSVRFIMGQVLLALVPGLIIYVTLMGPAILLQLAIGTVVALLAEALMLRLRNRPVGIALSDGSAVVTAWLLVLCLPPTVPWWITVLGVAIAVVAAKQLYGGLGQNPFNPAMAAYCTLVIAYPAILSQWPSPGELDTATQIARIFADHHELDALSGATVLDALRTALRDDTTNVSQMAAGHWLGGLQAHAWGWVAAGWLLGGLYLLLRRIITWHLPAAFLGTLLVAAGLMWLIDPSSFASPLFHLFAGGSLLAAFFIITDPVSGATTPTGKLVFGAGVALIALIIRNFGAYPDGIAFGVLLLNLCVPLLDMKTQPAVFGHRERRP